MENEKINAGLTIYERDQSIVRDLPPFTFEELREVERDFTLFIEENIKVKNFMLLSNELRYYTLFQMENKILTSNGIAKKILEFITTDTFLEGLGKLKVFKRKDVGQIELWIGETYFVLFNADSFFVPI